MATATRALEQEGIPQDPLEIAATYDQLRVSDWKLVESRNGLSVFIAASPSYGVLLLLCYDQVNRERECTVVSPSGVELLRIAGHRVRAISEEISLEPIVVNKVDRFIDNALEMVTRAEGKH